MSAKLVSSTAALAAAFAAMLVAAPLRGQAAPLIALKPANARLDDGFTFVSSVRELSNGRLLLTDEKENRLQVADFASGQTRPIGRIGSGPGEYRQVGRLWALGGDSTLIADPFTRRRLVLNGEKIVATRATDGGMTESGLVLGADRTGFVATSVHSLRPNGKLTGLRDSMYLLRSARGRKVDTVARVPSEYATYDATKPAATLRIGAATTPRIYKVSITPLDQAVMFPDGWIAIARSNPYRVDWCPPSGPCMRGPDLSEAPVRITDADKRAYLQYMVRTANWPADLALSKVTGWPEYMPAFTAKVTRIDASPLIAMPDGRLLVERLSTASAPGSRYDVVDRHGARVGRLQLPDNQRIVGFGPHAAYVAVIDDEGLERLQRHPW